MANPVVGPTVFGGKFVTDLLFPTIAANNVLTAIRPTVKPGFKGKAVIGDGDGNIVIDTYTPRPVWSAATQAWTYQENSHTLCRYQAIAETENDAMINTYLEMQLASGQSAQNWSTQTDMGTAAIAFYMQLMQRAIGDLLLLGGYFPNSGPYSFTTIGDCPGWLDLIADNAPAANLPTISAANLLVSDPTATDNVLTELQKVIRAMPAKYRRTATGAMGAVDLWSIGTTPENASDKPVLFVSDEIGDTLAELKSLAFATGNANYTFQAEGEIPRIMGHEVVSLENFPADQVMFTSRRNLTAYVDLESDWQNLRVQDLTNTSELSEITRFRSIWAMLPWVWKVDAAVLATAS